MRKALGRLGWFFGLWVASVTAIGAVAFIIRSWLL